jgi:hypothetical protein
MTHNAGPSSNIKLVSITPPLTAIYIRTSSNLKSSHHLTNNHNASHINHQERALRRSPPLLLRCGPPNGRGLHWLWFIEGHRLSWRVRATWKRWKKPKIRRMLTDWLVTLSPSARLPLRSSTSARKRRPSTSTHHWQTLQLLPRSHSPRKNG